MVASVVSVCATSLARLLILHLYVQYLSRLQAQFSLINERFTVDFGQLSCSSWLRYPAF